MKIKIPSPLVYRVGTTKTMWVNFSEIVRALNRDGQHFLDFIIIELGTTANINGNSRLIIKGNYRPN